MYQRPVARPDTQDALIADTTAGLPRPATGDELRATLLALVGSPHLCSRAFITEQYDRYVRGNTVLSQPADTGDQRLLLRGFGGGATDAVVDSLVLVRNGLATRVFRNAQRVNGKSLTRMPGTETPPSFLSP